MPEKPKIRDGTHQAYRAWVDTEADRRRERFEGRRRGLNADRRQQRAQLTTFRLFITAIEREGKISAVPAGNPEPSRGGSERAGPPIQQLLDDDPAWREHWQVIRYRLERIHEKLDEAEGLGPVGVVTMLGVEKDQEIVRKGVGLSPQAVVDLLGPEIAGSAETVRRVRRRLGYAGKDGTSLEART